MFFVLLVTGAPYSTQNAYSAYLFANAVIQKKHIVKSIFFYRDGVYNANKNIKFDKDEFNLIDSWNKLSIKYSIDLFFCITSAIKRGIIENSDINNFLNYGKNCDIISNQFKITSLSTLTKSLLTCDRLVQF
ncbi:sulfurtransferase complex subunit TusD [Enterobacteriaceae endosymbiont of Donacia tomentosa]|uniref:sulfurtransferase complex subunit TusD n=1 Tax=Enterobacteriaceae endosymbiont of Donacia tomentosa TaxID=2675787 RepID=UPI00144982EC|nr:sulfurtransferase complex subunit TusD [Enterobacteriaceae endosymbiont of Donacia tomentosa]QJC31761.1 sulfurtransferase complex subunit TusD [Enterobacteriaceae endosymbiont of Donacia tomentosa]